MAQVIVVDSDSRRGKYLSKVLERNGYQSRFVKSKGDATREIYRKWGWAEIVFLAGGAIGNYIGRPEIFKVVYPNPHSPMISAGVTRFFLHLINELAHKQYTSLLFNLSKTPDISLKDHFNPVSSPVR